MSSLVSLSRVWERVRVRVLGEGPSTVLRAGWGEGGMIMREGPQVAGSGACVSAAFSHFPMFRNESMETYNLVSLAGIPVLIALAWLLSIDRRVFNWRVVLWGLAIQMAVAALVFLFPIGTRLILGVNTVVVRVLDSASAGSRFLFGRLALPPGVTGEDGEQSLGFFLAFQALPAVVFFSSLMAGLYHIGLMPLIVRAFARVFSALMRISGAESLCASSNIFVGIESALTVKPYLAQMTRSELGTILAAGMGTIASSMLAVYVFMLRNQFPTIAGHLVTASLLSAPAAVVMAKVLIPETGTPVTRGTSVSPYHEKHSGLMEAIIAGAGAGMKLVAGIAALLLAFLGFVALVNLGLEQLGHLLGAPHAWSVQRVLGVLFYPFTLVIGVPPADAAKISAVIGERLIATEVKSYQELANLMSQGALIHPRSAVLAAYALCGFAHVASLAIFVGGISALVPERTNDIARVGPRALLAATLACLMTACVAGTFFTGRTVLFGGPQ
jgi:CNT family concentrative nucleoside transporter